MSPLSTYLWKEWREQRATLGVLAAALCAGVLVVALTIPRRLAGDPLLFQGVVAMSLLVTIMSVGSDLLSRERAGAGLGFLERLPAGLVMAFRAKLVFLILALAAAAAYGVLLATTVALLRTGAPPQGPLEGATSWGIAVVLGVSLWVFAVSAWVPASALTFPGTLLLLGAFAWPAILAVKGDPLFRPTTYQGLAFVLLCLAGAPVSAWAAFVFGSRLGRSRRRAALAGLAVAALFFSPTWAWAAGRYASLVNAPFEIAYGWVGPSGRYAFLSLTRRAPPGIPERDTRRWDRYTALLVDLESGSWSFPGEVDASTFAPDMKYRRRQVVLDERQCTRATLVGFESARANDVDGEVIFDTDTARPLSQDEAGVPTPLGPSPLDFGLDFAPKMFRLHWAGLGHRLTYLHEEPQDEKRWIVLYRDLAGDLIVDRDAILPRDAIGNSNGEVRIRPRHWLVRSDQDWSLVDPTTFEHTNLEGMEPSDRIGPILEDGRALVTSEGEAFLLDPGSGHRTRLRTLGRQGFPIQRIDRLGTPAHRMYPLPVDSPTVVALCSPRERTLGLLDVSAGTLRIQAANVPHVQTHLLWTHGSEAILREEGERLVRYDVARDEREVLFDVGALP